MDCIAEYKRWLGQAYEDGLMDCLKEIEGNEAEIEKAFAAGLQVQGMTSAEVGPGTANMNVYTVAAVSQAISDFMYEKCSEEKQCVAISFDDAEKSETFARTAAGTLAANGIVAFICQAPSQEPVIESITAGMQCGAGLEFTQDGDIAVMHIVGEDGAEFAQDDIRNIQERTEKLDIFDDVLMSDFGTGYAFGKIRFLEPGYNGR